ncbi:MAG: SRPBCC family protein [Maritimibacter sp.]
MSTTLHLTHAYDATPDQVWQVATDMDALREAVAGLLVYENLPSGRIFEGQEIDVRFSLFGKLPWQDYHMKVTQLDETARSFVSAEHGGGVKAWCHKLRVEETPSGARIIESIEIDAGIMTPIYAAWGRFMYRRRHAPRVAMLARLTKP